MIITNKFGAPEPLRKAAETISAEYDGLNRPWNEISVTELTDAPRQRYLKKLHWNDITVDVTDQLWAIRSQSLHDLLARSGSGYMRELRLKRQFGEYVVSGKFDLFDPAENVLWDWKETSVWQVVKNRTGKFEHDWQLNIYGYLIRKCLGMEVRSLKAFVLMRDWSQKQYMISMSKGEYYPDRNIIIMEYEIMSDATIEEYINLRLREHFEKPDTMCDDRNRWAKFDYAIQNRKGHVHKKFDTYEDAKRFLDLWQSDVRKNYEIITRSEDGRCAGRGGEGYCIVKRWCDYWQQRYAKEDIEQPVQFLSLKEQLEITRKSA